MAFVGIFELGVAMIECIQSSGWTGYMLMKVRDDITFLTLVSHFVLSVNVPLL